MDCGIEYPHKIGDARAAMEDRLKEYDMNKIIFLSYCIFIS
jgi:hypothetical protein